MRETHSHQAILYSFRRCPYAMRARLALYAAGIIVEIREIDLRDKHPLFLQTSPKGTVPVLVLPNDSIIDESLDIVNFVCDKEPNLKATNQDQYLQWLNELNDTFRPASHRIKYPERFDNIDIQAEHSRCQQYCQTLHHALQSQPYLHGDTLGQADFVIFPFIRQLYRVNKNILSDYNVPMLTQWLHRITDNPLFLNVMKKHPVWKSP